MDTHQSAGIMQLTHLVLATLTVCAASSVAVDVQPQSTFKLLETAGITNDLGFLDFKNVLPLTVRFNNVDLIPGEKFDYEGVSQIPQVVCNGEHDEGFYTLIVVDPDAPSRADPTARYWLHFMNVNLQGSDLTNGGENKCSYLPPGPPVNTGYHRYVFLLFKQQQELHDVATCGERASFDLKKFVEEKQLGAPFAANFFEARHP